jgi:catechol 2,3-dioxygenase-like lactoylglutathione lyase family enzyme
MAKSSVTAQPAVRAKPDSIIKPYVLSHGTCECFDIAESRRFYEEFLGLECVQIAKDGLIFALGLNFHVVCLQTGERLRPLSLMNHWGVEVRSREEVQQAHARAHELKDKYKIGNILPIEMVGGRYSFYMEDLNHSWWEVQYYKGCMHEDFFDFGDMTE